MKILNSILTYDLHKKRGNQRMSPLMLEVPAKKEFIPAIVSSTTSGKFLVSTGLTADLMIRTGVFESSPSDLDKSIGPLFDLAFDLSKRQKYPNIFRDATSAFDYVQKTSGFKNQPHLILIPEKLAKDSMNNIFGSDNLSEKNYDVYYKSCAKLTRCNTSNIVFLSNPEFVGLHTRLMCGASSILLHNVKLGISFINQLMNFVESFVIWAHSCVLDSDESISYLMGRGVSESQINLHKIGYVGGSFEADSKLDPYHNVCCGDHKKSFLWCDSCIYNEWSSGFSTPGSRIIGNIVLPLTSLTRKVVGFQLRSIQGKNYDSFLSKKSPEAFFFGASIAVEHIWKNKSAILVEGPFDQLVVERLVKKNVLGLTTSSISKSQKRALARLVSRVYLGMDYDKAGREGVENFIKYSSEEFECEELKYSSIISGVKDPGDLWKLLGDTRFKQRFSNIGM